jgi:hypothetical protein
MCVPLSFSRSYSSARPWHLSAAMACRTCRMTASAWRRAGIAGILADMLHRNSTALSNTSSSCDARTCSLLCFSRSLHGASGSWAGSRRTPAGSGARVSCAPCASGSAARFPQAPVGFVRCVLNLGSFALGFVQTFGRETGRNASGEISYPPAIAKERLARACIRLDHVFASDVAER